MAKRTKYTVTWQITISADNPEDAARKAQMIQRDHHSLATFFEVRDENEHITEIDLEELDFDKSCGAISFNIGDTVKIIVKNQNSSYFKFRDKVMNITHIIRCKGDNSEYNDCMYPLRMYELSYKGQIVGNFYENMVRKTDI
jgi:hypothetical protein